MQHRVVYTRGTNVYTSCKYFVNISPVVYELKLNNQRVDQSVPSGESFAILIGVFLVRQLLSVGCPLWSA